MQRFGSYNIHTHEIGIDVLKQDWIQVIKHLLGQHPDLDMECKARKQQILNKVFGQYDIESALILLDRRDRQEKSILLNLRKNLNGWYNAFQCLPRNTRFIYLHAYQSYVWNSSVSERLKKYGSKVLVGDLAVKKDQAHLIDNEIQIDDEEGSDDEGEEKPQQSQKVQVIDVTKDNIKDFTLQDIVMPMVGYETRMPRHKDLQDIVYHILAKDGIALDHFQQLQQVAATSASGGYRRIVSVPKDVSYDVVKMQNENEDLLVPDYLERPDPTPEIGQLGKVSKALRMRFSLPTSSYATMMIREVTRISSAYVTQKALSKANESERDKVVSIEFKV